MNYGVIIRPPEPDDYVFGGLTRVVRDPLLAPGESWSLVYRPIGERQWTTKTDTMACVSFSALNVVEWVMNYKIMTGRFSLSSMVWLHEHGYLDGAGFFNASDRFTAKMSGTTRTGNYLSRVGQSIRHDGVVPESMWPFIPNASWEEYYAEIPESIQQLGKEFARRFNVQYEAVRITDAADALLYSPVQAVVHSWDVAVDNVFTRTDKELNHAVTLYRLPPVNYEIFDHFVWGPERSFSKQLAPDYILYEWGYIYSITEKPLTENDMLDVQLIESKGKKLVLGVPSGKFYHVKNGTLREIESDRAALAALMMLIELGYGTGVKDEDLDGLQIGKF